MVLPSPNNGGHSNTHISVPDLLHSFKHGANFHDYNDDLDSNCSTPYVSAHSSPGRTGVFSGGAGFIGSGVGGGFNGPSGYFFSAPTSPMHCMFSSCSTPVSSSSSLSYAQANCSVSGSSEFEFSSRFSSEATVGSGSMISADELFFNGQIRPMKLSSHLQRPQTLAPLLDLEAEEDEDHESRNDSKLCEDESAVTRGRDLKLRNRSVHRKTRSMSPLQNSELRWPDDDVFDDSDLVTDRVVNANRCDESEKQIDAQSTVDTPPVSTSSSRSSSSGSRNTKKWIFLKEFLYKSKSEGSGGTKEKDKFWSSISFSPAAKDRTATQKRNTAHSSSSLSKPLNGVVKRRTASPHELHYTTKRAQAEELKKKTYLPYRQGLFGCLGFSSKGYGALNGFARTLNPVSSR